MKFRLRHARNTDSGWWFDLDFANDTDYAGPGFRMGCEYPLKDPWPYVKRLTKRPFYWPWGGRGYFNWETLEWSEFNWRSCQRIPPKK